MGRSKFRTQATFWKSMPRDIPYSLSLDLVERGLLGLGSGEGWTSVRDGSSRGPAGGSARASWAVVVASISALSVSRWMISLSVFFLEIRSPGPPKTSCSSVAMMMS